MTPNSPLNGIKRGLNVLANVTLMAFVLSLVVALIWGTPGAVQRLGALWIAIVLFTFGFTKIIVNSMYVASTGTGEHAGLFDEKVGSLLKSSRSEDTSPDIRDSIIEKDGSYTKEEVQVFLADLDNHVSNHVVTTDIFIVACATLVTGFGDLLFCLLRSAGHSACSS